MTEELFSTDAYLSTCEATVLALRDGGVVLDRTVFYARGGGQPGDSGVLRWGDRSFTVADTIKEAGDDGAVLATLDRSALWAVQTPQAFRAPLLREAHEKARRDGVVGTDDAMLIERLGQPVRVVPGLAGNVKITTPEDLRRARARR